MCGGMYEEELAEEFATDQFKDDRTKKPMGDIKFMTAGDFIAQQQDDDYYYPGSDAQI